MRKPQLIFAAIALLAVIGLLLLVLEFKRQGSTASLGPEPVYNGRPLHEWAMETQDQSPDSSPSPMARNAANAVLAIGPKAAIPWLIKWIQPPWGNSELPGGAAECFRIFGPQADSAIPDLVKILNTPSQTLDDISAKSDAAKALSYLGTNAIPFMLTVATNLQEQQLQEEVIADIGNFGTNGVTAIPALIGWTHDPDARVRLGAVNALGQIAMEPEKVVPVLRSLLQDPDALVRRDAADALASYGKNAGAMLPDLIKALDDPDWQAQTGAIEALGNLGEQREVVLPLLVKKLHDPNRIVRRASAFALGNLGGKEAFDALMQATDDPDGFVREAVFQSLKKIDPVALQKSGKKFY